MTGPAMTGPAMTGPAMKGTGMPRANMNNCKILPSYLARIVASALLLAAAAAKADINWENVWVRAMPPAQTMTAAYGVITNGGTDTVIINGGSADFAKRVELHKSIQEGDSVRMAPMGAVELAPGESLKLMPGGAHIMLMGISDMPTAESTVSLCLTTQEGANCTTAQVLRKGPQSDHDAHHLHMNH